MPPMDENGRMLGRLDDNVIKLLEVQACIDRSGAGVQASSRSRESLVVFVKFYDRSKAWHVSAMLLSRLQVPTTLQRRHHGCRAAEELRGPGH